MKDSEEALEKVLGGLRNVAVPEAMERRILAAMEERAAVRARGWMPALGWVLAGGAALVMAVVLAGHRTAPQSPVQVAVRASPPQTVGLSEMGHPESVEGALPRRVSVARPTHRKVRDQPGTEIVAAPAPVEMSMVAPPMPLTAQEMLLVQVVRRGEPEKLPVLDPDGLAKREVESEARFRARFVDNNDVEKIGATQ